ncbi:MAG: hypothetical protein COU28_00500 [Candidatus Magasanikbacteria bacterium CG10_big_fil_rev_8_21_14_0_10_36_16]|uniref:ABC transporter permease n=1 Tax=Candidatus Magasanikbacteria bacterium CG10_big_fil_rev_8_21_14_0_10_36_16 TaxID=1974645 RepID=A0A2H0U1D7_9BACT|nr:MAG: hypothetical protein COU28_00500 [Candidatus Magasanikbacteria bacterium CG10_big_fil_rev_8_21_14_0_10_36_16]
MPKKNKQTILDNVKNMRYVDTLSLSMRTFKTRPMRTALTILGVSVGIGAVLFLVSFGYGLQETVLNNITTADALLSLDVSSGKSDVIQLNQDSIDKITNLPNVTEVSPVVALPSQITLKEFTADTTLYTIKPSFLNLSGLVPFRGTFFKADNNGNNQKQVVISSAMAQLFNIDPTDIVGQQINITTFVPRTDSDGQNQVDVIEQTSPFTIVGVVDDERSSLTYVPADVLENITYSTYVGAKVKVSNSEAMTSVREQIINMGFLVSVLQDTIDQVKKIFSIVQVVLGLFGLIALTVSAIGMFNTMTVMLLERTNEIGIMRSIGVTRKDVRKLFIFEAMIMGFLGGLGGVLLGYLGGFLANIGINVLAHYFGGQALDLFSSPTWFIVLIILFSTIIGLLTGIFPAQRAAKINPLDALRYK